MNEPTAPQNFDNIPRYTSNLPLDRVNKLRLSATVVIAGFSMAPPQDKTEEVLLMFAGYVMELTQPK